MTFRMLMILEVHFWNFLARVGDLERSVKATDVCWFAEGRLQVVSGHELLRVLFFWLFF